MTVRATRAAYHVSAWRAPSPLALGHNKEHEAGLAFYVDCLASHDRFPFLPLGAAGFLSCFATFSSSASIARGCAFE
jgi:hypothetical protein